MPEWVWYGIGILVWAVDLAIGGIVVVGLYLVVTALPAFRAKPIQIVSGEDG